ncbi:MAG: hypothetical protein WAU88_03315 [Candidatus Zixiibacteriota bacterium]
MKRVTCLFTLALVAIVAIPSIAYCDWVKTSAPYATLSEASVRAILCTNQRVFAASDTYGIIVSDDRGDNWTEAFASPPYWVRCLASRGNEIFAGMYANVYHSLDNGVTWSTLGTGLPNDDIVSVTADADILLAATLTNWLYRYSPQTSTWELVQSGLRSNVGFSVQKTASHLFAGVGVGGGFYESNDNGYSWTMRAFGNRYNAPVISIAETDSLLVLGTSAGLFTQRIGSNSWISSLGHSALSIAVSGSYVIAAGSSVNVYYLGTQWYSTSLQLNALSVATDGVYAYVGSEHLGLYRSLLTDLPCCAQSSVRGNLDGTGITNLADLSVMVSYLTAGSTSISCPVAGDLDGTGVVDIADLSGLVNYLTGGDYVLRACPMITN